MKITSLLPLAFSIAIVAGFVTAGEDSTLTIDGEVFVTKAAAPAHLENVDEIFSGWTFRLDETQALQMDDFDNPAFVFVDQALDQFEMVDGSAGKACSSCHDSAEVFSGLRASMPRVNSAGELETIPELINNCRTERMGAEKWKWSGGQMSAMLGLIGLQSRGMPVEVAIDGPAASFWEKRQRALLYAGRSVRYGMLKLSRR